jgi:hypothetical protein
MLPAVPSVPFDQVIGDLKTLCYFLFEMLEKIVVSRERAGYEPSGAI